MRAETRTAFDANKHATQDELPALLRDADDAILFLKHNVVQTVRSADSGNFVLTPQPEHLTKGDEPAPLPCDGST
mgnify:CR=1 FL=1